MEAAESNKELDKYPPKAESAPWLVFIPNHTCNKKSAKSNVVASSQTFYSISQGKSYIKDMDVMRGFNCWSTPQGWIFMQEPKSRKCCLWNPTASVKINVSSYKWNFSSEATCVLSSSPLEPKSCRLMCLDNGGRTFFVYNLESNEWVRHDVNDIPLYGLIVLNGQFYCITTICELAVIDLIPNIKVRVLDETFPDHQMNPLGREFRSLFFFLDSNGEIFYVEIYLRIPEYSSKAIHIVVLRKDCSNETWNHVDQIGDKVFFLGPGDFAASCSANELKLKGNCIYFLYEKECCVHVFDMNEGTIQFDAPCPEFLYSESSTLPFWIVPSK